MLALQACQNKRDVFIKMDFKSGAKQAAKEFTPNEKLTMTNDTDCNKTE